MVGTCEGWFLRALCQGAHLTRRITSTWASAAVWLIHSSRFQFNIKHDQEEKMREAPLYSRYPGTVAGVFTRSPALGVRNCGVCALPEDHGETQPWCLCGKKDQWLSKEYALNTLFQVNCEQEHNTSKNNMAKLNNLFTAGLPSLTLQYCNSFFFFLQYLKLLYITLFRQRKSGKYFSFKVINMIGEKKITHLPKSAFCWENRSFYIVLYGEL